MQLAQEETDLARAELNIAQERLHVCESHTKSSGAREHELSQDLNLCQSQLRAADGRLAEAERTLRQNDCSAIKRDLHRYRDLAEQAEIDKELLKQRVDEIEGELSRLSDASSLLEKERFEKETAESSNKVLTAELDATKRALESLLASLDARNKYEELLRKHQTEWIPHWMELGVSHAQSTLSHWAQKLQVVYVTTYRHCVKFYSLQVTPLINRMDALCASIVPGWMVLSKEIQRGASIFRERIDSGIQVTIHGAKNAEHAVENALFVRLEKLEWLQSRHGPEQTRLMLRFAVRGILLSLLLPILYSIASGAYNRILYVARPGTAKVDSRPRDVEFEELEETIGYEFTKPEMLDPLFSNASDGRRVRESLEWVGSLIAEALIAGESLDLSSIDTQTQIQVQTRVQRLLQSPEMLHDAAQKVGLGRFVHQGPGVRSKAVADGARRRLFLGTLGAVYLDSEMDADAVRQVLQKASLC